MTTTPQSIDELLAVMVERDASDLHMTAGSPPVIRVNGRLERLVDYEKLSTEETRTLIYRIISTEQQKHLETNRHIDFSHSIPGLARFSVNAFFQRESLAAAFRLIPARDQLARGAQHADAACTSSPRSRAASCSSPARPARESRRRSRRCSTTSTSTRHEHILTIEDPIEFLHWHRIVHRQPARARPRRDVVRRCAPRRSPRGSRT